MIVVHRAHPSEFMPDPAQPRVHFDRDVIESRGRSIQNDGQQQPLKVRPAPPDAPRGVRWMLIDGEVRWRGAVASGIESLEFIVEDGLSPEQIFDKQLAANIEHEGFTLGEICRAIARYKDEFGRTHQYLADNQFYRFAKGSERWVGDRYRAWNAADAATRRLMDEYDGILTHVEIINTARTGTLREKLIALVRGGATVDDLRAEIALHQIERPRSPENRPAPNRPPVAVSSGVATGYGDAKPLVVAPSVDEGDFFEWPDEPDFDAQAMSTVLKSAEGSIQSFKRHLATFERRADNTPLVRQAFITRLEKMADECRSLCEQLR